MDRVTLEAAPPKQRLLDCVKEHFDPDYYLRVNADVADAGTEPVGHYILFGLAEGRAPNARMTGAEMQSVISGILGTIPGRDELQSAYQEHRQSSSVLRRLTSTIRNTVRPGAPAGGQAQSSRAWRLPLPFQSRSKQAADLADWVNVAAFNALNRSGKTLNSRKEVADHVRNDGYKTLDPLDFHLVPDPPFHRSMYPATRSLDDETLYLRWLETGYCNSEFISEAHLLHDHGITATRLLSEFPHEAYREAYADLPAAWSSAQLLLHYLRSGIPEGRFNFAMSEATLRATIDAIVFFNRSNQLLALDLAERLLLLGHESARLRLIAIHHYKNLNRLWGARHLLDNVESKVPIEQFWINYHRGDLERRLGKLDEARPHFAAAADVEKDSVWVETEVENLLRSTFSQECQIAEKWAKAGRVEEALGRLELAITGTYEALKPYGWPVMPKKPHIPRPPLDRRPLRIGFLADLFLPQCRLYRVDQKIEQMSEAGIDVDLFDFRNDATEAFEQVGLYDAWLFYRVPAHFDVLKVVRLANDLGLPTIYEIDDFLLDPDHFPEPYESYDQSVSAEEYNGLQLTTAYNGGVARLCEYGLASTPPLAGEMARFVRSGHVFTHRNALSVPHMKAISASRAGPPRETEAGDTIRIFYGSGTKAHKDFLQAVFFDAVAEVLQQRPNVEFHTIGHVEAPALTSRFPDRVVQGEPIWNVADYWKKLSTADINVGVLKKSLLTDCKSEIKWLEAAMLGIPSIVSGTSTMTDIVKEGENGMIANSRDDWVEKLLKLVDDAALRKHIGETAREQVLEDYSLQAMAANIDAGLKGLFGKSGTNRARGKAKAS